MKYKPLIIILIMLVATICITSVAMAGSTVTCTPDTGYDYCVSYTQSLNCVKSTAKVQVSGLYTTIVNGINYLRTDKPVTVLCTGSRLYFYDFSKISMEQALSSCGTDGCSGFISELERNKPHVINFNDYAPINPGFLCYTYTAKDCSGVPTWTWAAQIAGWDESYWSGKILQKNNLICSSDSQCATNQYCNIKSSVLSSCDAVLCDGTNQVIDHKCIIVTIPQMCIDAGYTTVATCQDYVVKYASIIEGNLQSKIDAINQMQLTIDQTAKIITDLTQTAETQGQIISQLNLTIQEDAALIVKMTAIQSEQAIIINQLDLTINEQAVLIKAMQLKVSEQASLINELTKNLEIKAALVNQLTAENQHQADLIKEMKLSFTNQGIIVDALNLTVIDDARIIGQLTSNINEQAQIVSQMKINAEEMTQLINKLQSNNAQMQEFVSSLNIDNAKLKELINELTKQNQLSQQQIANLQEAIANAPTTGRTTSSSVFVSIMIILVLVIIALFVGKKKKKRR